VTIALIVHALFMDFGEKPDRDRESRDRKLFQLIEKSPRPVVLFIDDAHRLQAQTLAGLEGLVEKKLGVVLVGHPRLGFKLARGLMEEIGLRCEHLEMRGLEGGVEPYLAWLLAQAGGSTEIILSRIRRPNAVPTLCRNRISRFEQLSTSETHWSTTKSDRM
jgi:type II secretory pathway predicted ATPase ExeA